MPAGEPERAVADLGQPLADFGQFGASKTRFSLPIEVAQALKVGATLPS